MFGKGDAPIFNPCLSAINTLSFITVIYSTQNTTLLGLKWEKEKP